MCNEFTKSLKGPVATYLCSYLGREDEALSRRADLKEGANPDQHNSQQKYTYMDTEVLTHILYAYIHVYIDRCTYIHAYILDNNKTWLCLYSTSVALHGQNLTACLLYTCTCGNYSARKYEYNTCV